LTHTDIEKSVKLSPPVKSIRSLYPSKLTPLRDAPAPQLGVGMNVFVTVGVTVGVVVAVLVGVGVGDSVSELVAVARVVAVAVAAEVLVAVGTGVSVCASVVRGSESSESRMHACTTGRAQISLYL